MSSNITFLGYLCLFMIQILNRCMILWTIQQNYLFQMQNIERLSKKYLIECLIQDEVEKLKQQEEDLIQNLEYQLGFCSIRFETDEFTIKVSLFGDFNDFKIIERDKEDEVDIE